jgi:hypothetical protein
MEKLKMGIEKICIGYDDLAYQSHLMQSSEKLAILGEAVQEFKSQCNTDVVDMPEFEISFYDYALNYIKEKHKGGLVLGLTDQAFISLYGYNLDKLKSIDARYLIQVGSLICFKNIFKIDESLDFRIFAENEREVEKYNACVDLIKAVKTLHEKYFVGQCLINQLIFINRVYVTNPEGTDIIPNRYFIKQ